MFSLIIKTNSFINRIISKKSICTTQNYLNRFKLRKTTSLFSINKQQKHSKSKSKNKSHIKTNNYHYNNKNKNIGRKGGGKNHLISNSNMNEIEGDDNNDNDDNNIIVSDEFRSQLLEFKAKNAPRKLINYIDSLSNICSNNNDNNNDNTSSSELVLDHKMLIYALRTFQKMKRSDLIAELVPYWRSLTPSFQLDISDNRTRNENNESIINHEHNNEYEQEEEDENAGLTRLAVILIRSLCKEREMDLAYQIAVDLGVGVTLDNSSNSSNSSSNMESNILKLKSDLNDIKWTKYPNQNKALLESFKLNDPTFMILPELALGEVSSSSGSGSGSGSGVRSYKRALTAIKSYRHHQLQLQSLISSEILSPIVVSRVLCLSVTESKRIFKGFLHNACVDDIRVALRELIHVMTCSSSGIHTTNTTSSSSFSREERYVALYRELDLGQSKGTAHDHDFLQLLSNTFLRNLHFVKGAVSMDTLPSLPDSKKNTATYTDINNKNIKNNNLNNLNNFIKPEVAFIGRSNCGKSSLINCLTNRKGLAYTSKTPGKTSEFNYFDASAVVGRQKEHHGFYLVDIPGVGYARKDKATREGWIELLRRFTNQRTTLRTIFHLIDSRHGMLNSDQDCFELLETLPNHVQYVIVLTKADKRSEAGKSKLDMIEEIMHEVHSRIVKNDNYYAHVPVIVTSSESKFGMPQLWSILLDSIAGNNPTGFLPTEID